MNLKHEKGFTLIELIIVLAMIAIIGGILAPNFVGTTERARLRSDVQSAKIIQSAMELYEAENGTAVAGSDVEAVAGALVTAGYLNPGNWETQSDAVWVLSGKTVRVKVTTASLKAIAAKLTAQERAYITE